MSDDSWEREERSVDKKASEGRGRPQNQKSSLPEKQMKNTNTHLIDESWWGPDDNNTNKSPQLNQNKQVVEVELEIDTSLFLNNNHQQIVKQVYTTNSQSETPGRGNRNRQTNHNQTRNNRETYNQRNQQRTDGYRGRGRGRGYNAGYNGYNTGYNGYNGGQNNNSSRNPYPSSRRNNNQRTEKGEYNNNRGDNGGEYYNKRIDKRNNNKQFNNEGRNFNREVERQSNNGNFSQNSNTHGYENKPHPDNMRKKKEDGLNTTQGKGQQRTQVTPAKNGNQEILIIKPHGRKCWPEASIYIMGTRLSVCYRQILWHQADMLMIPYINLKMQIYPGKIVNSSRVNYRNKIEQKGEILLKVGSIYFQKCVGVPNFKGFGFLRIGESSENKIVSEVLKKAIQQFMTLASKVQRDKITSIVIPYSKELGHSPTIISAVLDHLEKNNTFKEIIITSDRQDDFISIHTAFQEKITSLILNNQVCID